MMRRTPLQTLAAAAVMLLALSCSRVPRHVIGPDEMASLLADIHVGEAVVEMNHAAYRTDSAKQTLLHSVLERHGVSDRNLDTSMDWYSHNLTRYMEVYDKTIELLEKRIAETGNRIAAENVSIAGDSVDIWTGPQSLRLSRRSPSRFVTFAIGYDENRERGDQYTWRMKFTNHNEATVWGMTVRYADGSQETTVANVAADGWNELRLLTDSTRTATDVAGYMMVEPRGASTSWADSIMLVRSRVSPDNYHLRYRQTRITPKNPVTEPDDDTPDDPQAGS